MVIDVIFVIGFFLYSKVIFFNFLVILNTEINKSVFIKKNLIKIILMLLFNFVYTRQKLLNYIIQK